MTWARGAAATPETATAAILALLGLVYGQQAWKEGLGTPADTGAGFFPAIVAAVLAISACVVLVQDICATADATVDDEDSAEFGGDVDWWRLLGVLAASLTVPLVADRVGFVVAVSVAVVVIAKIMGLKGWRGPLIMGLGFGAAVWLVFVQWLFVPLPAGQLGLA